MTARSRRGGVPARRAPPLLSLIGALALALAPGSLPAASSPPAGDAGLQPIPKLNARVTDLTGTLTAEQQTQLEQKLAGFESAKGAQLAVLIVPTTDPEEIEQYSIRVVEEWRLGRQHVDDGALLIVAKNDHRVRIEVGRGLEGVLTDALSNRIISETLRPAFREGNFYGGIEAGLDAMMKLIQGEPLPPPERGWGSRARARSSGGALPFILFAVLFGSVMLRGIFGRTLGSALTGAGAGLLVLLAGYAVALALLAGAGAFLFTLLGGLARGSGWSSYPRGGGFGGGWGGFGGGFGGGGFGGGGGGFSGGGGGFAGGGASGSW
ncbi:MAG TPA: YgcG family protein [Steroidobacteraceae bacterium]|nr:YgcG family protein [Steroidobacteraceae bacterium]